VHHHQPDHQNKSQKQGRATTINRGARSARDFTLFILFSSYLLGMPWVTDSNEQKPDRLPADPFPTRLPLIIALSQGGQIPPRGPKPLPAIMSRRQTGGNRRWSSNEAVLWPSSLPSDCLSLAFKPSGYCIVPPTHSFANLVVVLPVAPNVAILPHPLSNPPFGAGEISMSRVPRRVVPPCSTPKWIDVAPPFFARFRLW
jgi:hypothetical protein